jgi:hypothetical protein
MICLQQYMDQFGTSLGIAVVAESFNVEAVKLDWIVVMNVEETGCASVAATLWLVSIPVAAATSESRTAAAATSECRTAAAATSECRMAAAAASKCRTADAAGGGGQLPEAMVFLFDGATSVVVIIDDHIPDFFVRSGWSFSGMALFSVQYDLYYTYQLRSLREVL